MPRTRAISEPWASAMAAASIRSRNELADIAGVHPTTVSRLIDDPAHPSSLDTIRAVAKALKLDVRDVAHWSGIAMELDEPYTPPPEAALLNRDQRRVVDDVIRALVANKRHPRPPLKIQTTGVVMVSEE
ncbi:helix-turn-helix transcriptional regulator [Nocardia terpenica]|uniref:helix-turn-helix domain-containing protein n=1 Tax=Nocardia terpenica TaxID=455432 RepID=UPI0018960888|nr:helix-turn-helix transcriptional regulator [Nocardia terpenica]MBF6062840.1 helix-turn-helix transcriptional regulator [Nocardia terpenica]MBF6105025.1 helix-turn-helix transcriptional regulator [Nocardia terpenica]MBF6112538.1 helix-turn-helix transcriptional regulator [Nocardia terpenica]MBF6118753.1 helix-turn-helix transcriptional regulator [Nocardia terpenica]MBF6154222.1 helix-turn-helix transcriptional regulator [Nocardia terpenica]